MLIVGELINASRKAIGEAIKHRMLMRLKNGPDQWEAGADYIDVNAGIFVGKEADYLTWLVQLVQEATDNAPCCIDSPDRRLLSRLCLYTRNNHDQLHLFGKERYEAMIPLLAGTDLKVVALCMSDEGMPETADERLAIADKLINGLVQNNIPLDNIYVDPWSSRYPPKTPTVWSFRCCQGIMTNLKGYTPSAGYPTSPMDCCAKNKSEFCSIGYQPRLDGLIINPLDKQMMANIIIAETLVGRDNYCSNYLTAYREGKIE